MGRRERLGVEPVIYKAHRFDSPKLLSLLEACGIDLYYIPAKLGKMGITEGFGTGTR